MELNEETRRGMALLQDAISWVDNSEKMKGEKGNRYHRFLIDKWRWLRKKLGAQEGNPAAAMFGESQAGKSYLVSALLSSPGKPYGLYDSKGNFYNFKQDINPRGNEMESTSLVTRFSVKYKAKNLDYPIIANILTIPDIILVICEAYYHNLEVNDPLSYDCLQKTTSGLSGEYSGKPRLHTIITEPDIYDIEEYFKKNFSKLMYNNLTDVGYFSLLASIIDKVPVDGWGTVFSVLWNNNPRLTDLFNDLLEQYKTINFEPEILLPIDAVLRDKGTLLDVSRLNEIYKPHVKNGFDDIYEESTPVLLPSGRKEMISKPFLCALTAELIFALPEDTAERKPFLQDSDILDFPGTRRFETIKENLITNDALSVLLRRGKVDYLFNKYSNNEQINVLLFCQNHKQSSQSVMPAKINSWIETMMGGTPEEREKYMSSVPPLFVVSTWFNKDLEYSYSEDKPGQTKSLTARWEQRFEKTLAGEIFKTDTYRWFDEWTTSQRSFQNIFLLRDFDKSSETASQVFKGYNETGKEQEEIKPEKYLDFRKDLRQSFIDYPFVKQHFANPAEAWDRAASINEDGTMPIIAKLSEAARNINPTRLARNREDLKETMEKVVAELENCHESEETGTQLRQAISTAGRLQLDLDLEFNRDNYFFGRMMHDLLIDRGSVHNLFVEQLHSIEKSDIDNSDDYMAIRLNVPEISPDKDEKSNIEALCRHYEMSSPEECRKHFEGKGVNLHELFYGENERAKSSAQILIETLWYYWRDVFVPKHNSNLVKVFSEEGLSELIDMYQRLFIKLEVADRIAKQIRRHLDGYRGVDELYDMVSDISTEKINRFIKSVGTEYYRESDWNDLEKASENIDGLELEHVELRHSKASKESVAKIIDMLDEKEKYRGQQTIPDDFRRLPFLSNFVRWYDALKAGFVIANGVPLYDPVDNAKLGKIIDELRSAS